MTFAEELRHVAPLIDPEFPEDRIVILEWADAVPDFNRLMTQKGAWQESGWKATVGQLADNDLARLWAHRGELACWCIERHGMIELVRVIARLYSHEATSAYIVGRLAHRGENLAYKRALYDVGIRRLHIFVRTDNTLFITDLRRRGIDLQPDAERIGPDTLRYTIEWGQRP